MSCLDVVNSYTPGVVISYHLITKRHKSASQRPNDLKFYTGSLEVAKKHFAEF